MGVFRGIPDVFVLHNFILYGLEFKAPKGVMSQYQIDFRDNMVRHGGIYLEVRRLEDIMKYL